MDSIPNKWNQDEQLTIWPPPFSQVNHDLITTLALPVNVPCSKMRETNPKHEEERDFIDMRSLVTPPPPPAKNKDEIPTNQGD